VTYYNNRMADINALYDALLAEIDARYAARRAASRVRMLVALLPVAFACGMLAAKMLPTTWWFPTVMTANAVSLATTITNAIRARKEARL
jgi:hypothetical protein